MYAYAGRYLDDTKEVSERLLAQPGTRDYGRLTVTSAYYADIHLVTRYQEIVLSPVQK